METRIDIATKSGYIFVNGKLTAYEFKSAKVDFNTGAVEYTCFLGSKPATFETTSCPEVFKNEEDYLHGKALTNPVVTWAKALSDAFGFSLWRQEEAINNSGVCKGFTIVNNEVVECDMPVSDYVYANHGFKHDDKEAYHQYRDKAILYCDIIKVEPDGTEVVCPSPAKRVALNDEQMTALKAVEDALKKAHDLGVEFCFNHCMDEIHAYSNLNEKDYCLEERGAYINDFGYNINDLMVKVKASMMGYCMDDTALYVEFK